MPYIETTSNVSIPGRKEQVIKDRMGDAIEKIPGKTESWLMLSFRDNAAMYFKGTDAPLRHLPSEALRRICDGGGLRRADRGADGHPARGTGH